MLMKWLTEEYNVTSSYDKKMQILTLSPLSIHNTMKLFNTSRYMVDKSRRLRKEYGILPEIKKISKGKVITREIIAKVEEFYQSDDVSRICPGKSDFLSIRDIAGNKIHMQKRLLLGNLKELYKLYKEETPALPEIGFSSFANLRPKHCVIAGASGTHSICICTYHQNPKLMISAFGNKDINIVQLIEKCVCNMNASDCMLHHCRHCPGVNGILEFIESSLESDDRETINFSQWTKTDRSTLENLSLPVDEFINKLSNDIRDLTKHHFIAKKQSSYLKYLKDNIDDSQCIVIGDFSENYSFVVQDASQGFHWTNNQATIHPFIVYFISENNLSHRTFCFISDCLQHKTSLVYTFQKTLIPEIRDFIPNLKKVNYFTDGSIAQYKNKYNFINICHHEQDFHGILAEWNYFATSHGKNACDGIGGMVKRAAYKASLQRTTTRHILTPQDLYTFSQDQFPSIKFFFTPFQSFEKEELSLKDRFSKAVTIKGTQGFHKIKAASSNILLAYQTSNSDIFKEFTFGSNAKATLNFNSNEVGHNKPDDIQNIFGKYVATFYDNEVWLGLVEDTSAENEDVKINFMNKINSYTYYFPEKKDTCWIQYDNIIHVMSQPEIVPKRKIEYRFTQKDILQVNDVVKKTHKSLSI